MGWAGASRTYVLAIWARDPLRREPGAGTVAPAVRPLARRAPTAVLLLLLVTTACTTATLSPGASPAVKASWPASFIRGTYGRDTTCQPPGYSDDNGCHFGTGLSDMKGAGFNTVQAEPYPGALAALSNAGLKAVVWVGGWKKATCVWDLSDSQLTATINSIKGSPAILMYYLADEPLLSSCPGAPAAFAARTALVHQLDPGSRTFTLIQDWDGGPVNYAAWKGAVDTLGFDLYPCSFQNGTDLSAKPKTRKPCDFSNVTDANIRRIEAAGIARYIGVMQDFQDCFYELPTISDLRTQMTHWQNLATHLAGYLIFSWNFTGNPCAYGSQGQQLDKVPGNVAELSYDNAHFFQST
jgi:hypothetical protein